MTSNEVIKLLEFYEGVLTSEIIRDLIADDAFRRSKLIGMYNRYKGEVPIKARTFKDTTKVNNKLANDYRGVIIDGKVGYFLGVPISYGIGSNNYNENQFQTLYNEFTSFKTRNNLADLDNETAKNMAIFGHSIRLLYIDKEGKEKIINSKPFEWIVIENSTTKEIQYALRYYQVDYQLEKKWVKRWRVEWYDEKTVTYYLETEPNIFTLDDTEQTNPQIHLFEGVPVVKFVNNDEEIGDFEKVENLIDGYDRNLSDVQNEIEEFRLAYMIFKGANPDKEIVEQARITGAFGIDQGDDALFLTKNINDTFIENHKKTLNENIYKFSKCVDMSDENFSGASQSGESRRWKLQFMENDVMTKERKFVTGLTRQFKLLQSVWRLKEFNFNYELFSYQFTRNLPVDLKYVSEVLRNFIGSIPEEIRLSLAPFIPDAAAAAKQLKEEQGFKVPLEEL